MRVAESLGWTRVEYVGGILLPGHPGDWIGYPPPGVLKKEAVPRFDEGHRLVRLIEGYEIACRRNYDDDGWIAYSDFDLIAGEVDFDERAEGKTLGEAVCNLVMIIEGKRRR